MDNVEVLKKSTVWKLIAKLSIPAVIITLVMVVYNMADIFFIGQTGNKLMVAAISLCAPVFVIIQAIGTLIGGGGCTAISLALGKNDEDKIKPITSFCCYSSLIAGLLFAIVTCAFVALIDAAKMLKDTQHTAIQKTAGIEHKGHPSQQLDGFFV